MSIYNHLRELGFNQSEASCYLTLLDHHPVNGCRLSRLSGVSRSKVYDVLSNMAGRGLVVPLEDGLFAPLPPDELLKRLRSRFETNIGVLENHIKKKVLETSYNYIWTLKGYNEVMAKAGQMIRAAAGELYLRLDRSEGKLLLGDVRAAESRGVAIRYVSLGPPPGDFEVQITWIEPEQGTDQAVGRPIDVIVDQNEALSGRFQPGLDDDSSINWTRNQGFIATCRDSLKQCFYYHFLHKARERGQVLSGCDQKICDLIGADG